jgi:hypothetical protein
MTLGSVLKCLEHEKDYGSKQLKPVQEFIQEKQLDDVVRSRVAGDRAPARQTTPKILKDLMPETEIEPPASITWILSARTFEVYYPIPIKDRIKKKCQVTNSRTYGDKHTVLGALTGVVAKAWGWHKKDGYDACLRLCFHWSLNPYGRREA